MWSNHYGFFYLAKKRWNEKLTKWQVDEMASWQNEMVNGMASWWNDEMTSWWNWKLMKWQNDKSELAKLQVDKIESWWKCM